MLKTAHSNAKIESKSDNKFNQNYHPKTKELKNLMPLHCLSLVLARVILGAKGQLISKCLVGIFTFFQKTNENKSTSK